MPVFALALSSVVSLFFNPNKAYQAHQIASEQLMLWPCSALRILLSGLLFSSSSSAEKDVCSTCA